MLIVLIRVIKYRSSLGCEKHQNNALTCWTWVRGYLLTNFNYATKMRLWCSGDAFTHFHGTSSNIRQSSGKFCERFKKEVLWESIKGNFVSLRQLGSASGIKWHLINFWKSSRILTGSLERRHQGLGVTIWLESRQQVLGGGRNWLDCGWWTWRGSPWRGWVQEGRWAPQHRMSWMPA